MFNRDDPVHLLGRDMESVVAMIADASARADALQLAEARALFGLVSQRADDLLPPTGARSTAALMLGPVAALASDVDDIDTALVTAFDWLRQRPTFVLRNLGRRLEPLDLEIETSENADTHASWAEAFADASVQVILGRTTCRIVACGDLLQIRLRDPDTGRYLALASLPFDPEEDREAQPPQPQLAA